MQTVYSGGTMSTTLINKLSILAESAKYDISCSSSGTTRKNNGTDLGSAQGWGICHSFTPDGRCIALLKIMLTNFCQFDCAYCINRRSNDIPRAAFTPKELATLTIDFYRRNYIEGLFLSSGIVHSADHTMEKMIRVASLLRNEHHFNGYIHMKTIPGASKELIYQAGLLADRLSINLEIAGEANLKRLAPEKNHQSIYRPMYHIERQCVSNQEERKKFKHAPRFAPAGQSTQLIVGASDETDSEILHLTSTLYQRPNMKRVYYSGFVPVNQYDKRLPVTAAVPMQRENRLYQADWLLRFYHFNVDELVTATQPDLDLDIDPKLAWALRNPAFFPIDINRASYEDILRVPGIGVKSAQLIVSARQHQRLSLTSLKRIGVVLKRAQYFITCKELTPVNWLERSPKQIRLLLQEKPIASPELMATRQLALAFNS